MLSEAGSRPAATRFLLLRQKKPGKEKTTPAASFPAELAARRCRFAQTAAGIQVPPSLRDACARRWGAACAVMQQPLVAGFKPNCPLAKVELGLVALVFVLWAWPRSAVVLFSEAGSSPRRATRFLLLRQKKPGKEKTSLAGGFPAELAARRCRFAQTAAGSQVAQGMRDAYARR